MPLQFDHATALEFLNAVYSQRQAALVIGFTEGVPIKGDAPDRFDAILRRADTEHQHLFFHVARLKPEWSDPTSHAKGKVTVANKNNVDGVWEHVIKCPFLWLDCDANKFTCGSLDMGAPMNAADIAAAAQHYENEGVRVSAAIDSGLNKLAITPWAKWRSGAGWQCLIKLDVPILPEEAEVLVGKLHEYLGFDAVVRNPNRIIRVPGSINWKDGKDGRVPSSCTPLRLLPNAITAVADVRAALANSVAPSVPGRGLVTTATPQGELKVDWSKVNKADPWLKGVESLPDDAHDKVKIIVALGSGTSKGTLEDLKWAIRDAKLERDKPYGSWSEVTEALAAGLKLCKCWTPEWIAEAIAAPLPCNRHITKLSGDIRDRAVLRAINHAYESQASVVHRSTGIEWRDVKPGTMIPLPTYRNTNLAMENANISARYDAFHERFEIISGDTVQEIHDGLLTDNTERLLRDYLDQRFGLDLYATNIHDAVTAIALKNQYDPLLDMLNDAEQAWDGVKRLDRFAVDYLNCPDTELNCTIGALMLLCAVRRARRPGCKCDFIFTLLSKEGWNKSGAFETLAGSENFSDQKIFGTSDKEAQEQLVGIWFHENGELQGMSKSDIDAITTYLSRTADRARKAYAKNSEARPRRSIECGSTNEMTGILRKQTGNRRWLLLEMIKEINLSKLRADRLQLLGEAAARETENPADSLIQLPRHLWAAAGAMQEKHREKDDWEFTLGEIPDSIDMGMFGAGHGFKAIVHVVDGEERVTNNDLLDYVLRIPIAQRRGCFKRLAGVMPRFGWHQPNGGQFRLPGLGKFSGWVRAVELPLGGEGGIGGSDDR